MLHPAKACQAGMPVRKDGPSDQTAAATQPQGYRLSRFAAQQAAIVWQPQQAISEVLQPVLALVALAAALQGWVKLGLLQLVDWCYLRKEPGQTAARLREQLLGLEKHESALVQLFHLPLRYAMLVRPVFLLSSQTSCLTWHSLTH